MTTSTTPAVERDEIKIPEGYRSREIASFVAQLDDQLALLREDTRDLTPADLQWQPARGMNTIGMLLAHNAIVEVWWMKIGVLVEADPKIEDVLGIDVNGDGMPIEAGAEAFAALNGKDIAFYDDLHDRARAFLKGVAATLGPDDLERETTRTRANGTKRIFNIRYVFYHLLEHFAGHYGQILLLKHMRADTLKRA
ncbi:MAG TPA: DinB family protein [Candidatus Eisenbacteria bacterium]|nr:DinB family protein [Candidatus Eisenbacteria bacterium]